MNDTLILVGFWILCGLAAGWVSQQKGRGGVDGFLLGLFLGPLGLLMALLTKTAKPSDPVGPAWGQPTVPTAPPGPAWGQTATSTDAAFCPRCGTARAGGFRYCRSCGLDFDAA